MSDYTAIYNQVINKKKEDFDFPKDPQLKTEEIYIKDEGPQIEFYPPKKYKK